MVDELGYNVRTGVRDPRYKAYYISLVDERGLSDSDIIYARTTSEAERKVLKHQQAGTRVVAIELVEHN